MQVDAEHFKPMLTSIDIDDIRSGWGTDGAVTIMDVVQYTLTDGADEKHVVNRISSVKWLNSTYLLLTELR
jgi:hypothetical protein